MVGGSNSAEVGFARRHETFRDNAEFDVKEASQKPLSHKRSQNIMFWDQRKQERQGKMLTEHPLFKNSMLDMLYAWVHSF